jgi:putative hydrolase of the HAD superfamily
VTVDAVLLDAGGILVLPNPAVVRAQIVDAGLPLPSDETIRRAHYAGVAAMDASGVEDIPTYRAAFLTTCGADPELAARAYGLLKFRGAWNWPVPGAVEVLRALVGSGRRLAIVSNSDGTVAAELAALEICQVGAGAGADVAVVVDSHHVGAEKPDPRLFQLALAELGVPASRVVHVGDTARTDVDGALAAGVRPVHLDPYGLCPDPPDSHAHIADLAELPALLGE